MTLPLQPPLKPQLALSRKELPAGEDYVYEVKLDGFRCLAFVDGEEVFLQSRNGKPLGRYFPELVLPPGATCSTARSSCATATAARTSTRSASASIRPSRASSGSPRRRRRSTSPSTCSPRDDELAAGAAASRAPRRARGAARGRGVRGRAGRADADRRDRRARPQRWLQSAEGAIAKERSAPYRPGERKGMVKVKRVRTIDAVVVGWRPGKEQDTVGALILGLYDGEELRVVGHCSGLSAAEKRRLVGFLAPYESGERGSADPSRWSAGKDLEWVGLRPELVVEIDFDHVSRRAHPPRRQAAPLARGQGRRASAPSISSPAERPLASRACVEDHAMSSDTRDRRRGGVPADPVLAAGGRPADDRRQRRARDAALARRPSTR